MCRMTRTVNIQGGGLVIKTTAWTGHNIGLQVEQKKESMPIGQKPREQLLHVLQPNKGKNLLFPHFPQFHFLCDHYRKVIQETNPGIAFIQWAPTLWAKGQALLYLCPQIFYHTSALKSFNSGQFYYCCIDFNYLLHSHISIQISLCKNNARIFFTRVTEAKNLASLVDHTTPHIVPQFYYSISTSCSQIRSFAKSKNNTPIFTRAHELSRS